MKNAAVFFKAFFTNFGPLNLIRIIGWRVAGREKTSYKGLQLSFLFYSSRPYCRFVHNGQVRSALCCSTISMGVCRFFYLFIRRFPRNRRIISCCAWQYRARAIHRSILKHVYPRIYCLFVGLITKPGTAALRRVHIIVYAYGRGKFNEITSALCFNNFK